MTDTLALNVVKCILVNSLPVEWLVTLSEQTTCHAKGIFVRVDSEYRSLLGRQLFCLIEVRERELVITTPYLFDQAIQKIVKILKSSSNSCITITDCPLNCEICSMAWITFH